MGNSLRKLFQTDVEQKYAETLPGIGCIFGDPRSPTDGIHRTPIVVGKKPYLETDLDALTPPCNLRVQHLQREIDPRSPSSNIDRTPISILDSYAKSGLFESPVSLYSRYDGNLSTTYLQSPPEPSVNVSDFENDHFEQKLDSLVKPYGESILEPDFAPGNVEKENFETLQQNLEESRSNETLWKKQMCEDLINEIIESFKECQDVVLNHPEQEAAPKPNKSAVKKLSLSTSKENAKALRPLNRAPLSNITSAGNTPTKLSVRQVEKNTKVALSGKNAPAKLALRKDDKSIRVAPTGENSPLNALGKRYRAQAQWDHDSTVVI